MSNVLTMNSPRWLGWVLLVVGAFVTIAWLSIVVVVALFADEPWGDVAGDFVAFVILGVLAAMAGIRILKGTSPGSRAAS